MKTKGSKSAPTKRMPKGAKTPTQGGAPEVTVDGGTTVVMPNPADAPAPAKAARKKAAALVVTRPEATTPAEVPEWAKRAAAVKSRAKGPRQSRVIGYHLVSA